MDQIELSKENARPVKGGRRDAAALSAAQPELMRGVSKGVLHKNTVSRKIARLTKRVAALG